MLRRGCKVFLSETSVIYRYLRSIGIQVYSFESELTQENLDTPLSAEEKDRNREILLQSSTFEAAQLRFKELYELLEPLTMTNISVQPLSKANSATNFKI